MKTFEQQTYYELLEISATAPEAEVRAAYARALEQYSPDSMVLYSLVEPHELEALLARLAEAGRVLTEPGLRAEYDRLLASAVAGSASPRRVEPVPAAAAAMSQLGSSQLESAAAVAEPAAARATGARSADEGARQLPPEPGPERELEPVTELHTLDEAEGQAEGQVEGQAEGEAGLLPDAEPAGATGASAPPVLSPDALEVVPPVPPSGLTATSAPVFHGPSDSSPAVSYVWRSPSTPEDVVVTSLAMAAQASPPTAVVATPSRPGEPARLPPAEPALVIRPPLEEAPPLQASLSTNEPGPGAAGRRPPQATPVATASPLSAPGDEAARAGAEPPQATSPASAAAAPHGTPEPEAASSPRPPPLPPRPPPLPLSVPPPLPASPAAAAAAARPEAAEPSALLPPPLPERHRETGRPPAGGRWGEPQRPRAPEVPPEAEFNGELLRRVRESRGLSLRELADRTRISSRHLENVEADRYSELPATVYLRGMLMSVARELGLDALRVSKSYLALAAANLKRR